MSKSTTINIRMDKDLKKDFEVFCSDVGLTMTGAFNLFAKKAVSTQSIPFSIDNFHPNIETLEAMKEIEEMEKHPENYKSYTDVDKMFEDILCNTK